MIAKSSVRLASPKTINSNKLNAELLEQIGADIGVAVEYDRNMKAVGFRFEYPTGAGYSERDIADVLKNHIVEAHDDDDVKADMKRADEKRAKSTAIEDIIREWSQLKARVAALEDKRKD